MPELAEDGQAGAPETAAALDPPHEIGVRLGQMGGVGDEAGADFGVPTEAAGGFEFGAQQVGQRLEMTGVVFA